MTLHKSISRRFLYSAIFIGLNLLCYMGASHGSHMLRHTRVNYSHIPAHGSGRAGSRNGRSRQVNSADWLNDHGAQALAGNGACSGPGELSPAALPAKVVLLLPVTFVSEPLAREQVAIWGSAPSGTGLSRGPPSA